MNLIAEYLERAHAFERMAVQEVDPKLRAAFEKQAKFSHRLAEKRAQEVGLPPPKGEENST